MSAEKADRLRKALLGLKRGDCFCEMGIGNPMLSSHTRACQEAQAALDAVSLGPPPGQCASEPETREPPRCLLYFLHGLEREARLGLRRAWLRRVGPAPPNVRRCQVNVVRKRWRPSRRTPAACDPDPEMWGGPCPEDLRGWPDAAQRCAAARTGASPGWCGCCCHRKNLTGEVGPGT